MYHHREIEYSQSQNSKAGYSRELSTSLPSFKKYLLILLIVLFSNENRTRLNGTRRVSHSGSRTRNTSISCGFP